MIPKVIHYCWFGRNPMPKKFKKYISSWHKFCPDYEIKLWNEDNYDVNKNSFISEAYKQKKWAFVTDYVRVDVVEQFGGIYLDTDVELLKPLDSLLCYKGFAGFECSDYVNFGLGYGAEPHNPFVKVIRDFYHNLEFNEDTTKQYTGPIIQTNILSKSGLNINRYIEQEIDGFHIFPTEYFCPMNYNQIYDFLTDKTYSVHHFSATWLDKQEYKKFKRNSRRIRRIYYVKKTIKKVLSIFHLYNK